MMAFVELLEDVTIEVNSTRITLVPPAQLRMFWQELIHYFTFDPLDEITPLFKIQFDRYENFGKINLYSL